MSSSAFTSPNSELFASSLSQFERSHSFVLYLIAWSHGEGKTNFVTNQNEFSLSFKMFQHAERRKSLQHASNSNGFIKLCVIGKKNCALPCTKFFIYNTMRILEFSWNKECFSPSKNAFIIAPSRQSALNVAHFPLLISLMVKLHMLRRECEDTHQYSSSCSHWLVVLFFREISIKTTTHHCWRASLNIDEIKRKNNVDV